MVTVLQKGIYRLIETRGHIKILTLDQTDFAWVVANHIGDILVTSHNPHHADYVLARGLYRLYDVQDELHLSDEQHLELNVGDSLWQGYVLPHGLPNEQTKRTRIIPSKEIISMRMGSMRVGV